MERKYGNNQRIRIKSDNGAHKEPSREAKGAFGTIAIQSTSDWLGDSGSAYAESPPSYYVELENGDVELIGEEWLEAI